MNKNNDVVVNWSKVTLEKDKQGKIFVCGETQAQAEVARDCYEWLDKNKVEPEPYPVGITAQDLDRLYQEDKVMERLMDKRRDR